MNYLKLNLKTNNFLKEKFRNTKKIALTFVFSFFVSFLQAQQGDITNKLTEWSGIITSVLNSAVGIFALVGGFLIFIQYMQGNQDAQKNFIRFVIGLAIFGLVTLIANVFLPSPA
jgi:cytochrome bd-type quinol oxidase subunit 2